MFRFTTGSVYKPSLATAVESTKKASSSAHPNYLDEQLARGGKKKENYVLIIDACRLSKARTLRYGHSDIEDLRMKLREHASEPERKLIVTDGEIGRAHV